MELITSHDWVPEISSRLNAAQDLNTLLCLIPEIWRHRRYEGVVPHCINAARYRANQLTPRETVAAVDAEGLVYAASFKLKPKDVPDCITGMLRKIYKDTGPDSFIVSFDSDRRIKREKYPEYKSKREANPDVEEAKKLTIEELQSKGIQVEIHEGWEADDVLGSIAFQSQVVGDTCILVTTDSDLWQVLGADVTMYDRKKQQHHSAMWLKSEHRITGSQAVDWLVLVGKNDIKGARAIGPDKASKLLEAYGDIPNILNGDITQKQREAIEKLDICRLRNIHSVNRELPVRRARWSAK